MTFSRSTPQSLSALTLTLVAANLVVPGSHAQARSTASRSADIAVFAGGVIASPAYGPLNAGGAAFGLDYTRFLQRLPVDLSLELRANLISNSIASEHTYLFGLRAGHTFGRVTPYLDFLIGPGNIHFPQNTGYTGDNSVVPSYGGGLDLTVTHSFDLKLDLQGQHWNTGELQFTPTLGTVGVVYHIPFRRQYGQ